MSELTPKVSILVISYNEKEYLAQAVNSALAQTYANKEIIIGDDGSSDGSIEMIQKWKSEGSIDYFVMPRDIEDKIIPSIRVSNIIKRGLDKANGEYFTILSGDDYYTNPEYVAEAIEFLEQYPDYIAHVNGFRRVDEHGNVIDKSVPKRQSNRIYWSGDYTHISCFVFRVIKSSELLNRMCDDTGLEYVLAKRGKWKFGNKVSLAYRQREKSIQHEADQVEISIIEAMIYQDIQNSSAGSLNAATKSRFYRPISSLVKYRGLLNDQKYSKYIDNCKLYQHNILQLILDNKIRRLAIMEMWFWNRYFAVIRRLIELRRVLWRTED